jgi:serine/threonine-protein kinase
MTEVAGNTLVDGRYRVLQRLGSGGMADVYCAEDTHLGRRVALKVLHRRFAQDQEFVERFRREAKSAARLNHPNVVGVFDRGEHEGTYYIAMEYLEGRTLKEIVAAEAPLAQERVIDLGLQILQAAGFAHSHGVIHRDFKPHNVIVDDAGHAKVTDFGIARAGASEMTETGSIMGTAQYLSPEQAQGHAVTATSDIYSIGVMLYEMLAGRLPFEGDSAVAVALKHLSEPPAPISQWRPDIHPALEAVVMAALAKDPAHRWQSAEDLAAGLEAARSQIEAGSNGGQDTAGFAPIPMPVADETAPTQLAPATAPVVVDEAEPRRERRWPWYAIGALALALVAVLAYLVLSGVLAADKKQVPRVTGKQLVAARAVMEKAGFDVETERVQSAQPFDQVLDQDPNGGEEADEGSTVTLEVSGGPGEVLVPAVENLTEVQAVREIHKAGLEVTTDPEFSDKVKKGNAIRTVPKEGASVTKGTRVRLLVSQGPEQVTVPDVTGLSRDSAESRLRGAHLAVEVDEQESEDVPEGDVISQSPASGAEVARGSTVTIRVSTGKPKVTVPDVVGMKEARANSTLSGAGLTPVRQEREVTDPAQDGVVLEQRPGSGSEADKGSQVVIVVGVLKQDDTLAPAPTEP